LGQRRQVFRAENLMLFCQYSGDRESEFIYLDLPNQAVTCFLAPLTGGLALCAQGSAKNKFSQRTHITSYFFYL